MLRLRLNWGQEIGIANKLQIACTELLLSYITIHGNKSVVVVYVVEGLVRPNSRGRQTAKAELANNQFLFSSK